MSVLNDSIVDEREIEIGQNVGVIVAAEPDTQVAQWFYVLASSLLSVVNVVEL